MKKITYKKKCYRSPECISITHTTEGIMNASFIEVEKDDEEEFDGEFSSKEFSLADYEPWDDRLWETDLP